MLENFESDWLPSKRERQAMWLSDKIKETVQKK